MALSMEKIAVESLSRNEVMGLCLLWEEIELMLMMVRVVLVFARLKLEMLMMI